MVRCCVDGNPMHIGPPKIQISNPSWVVVYNYYYYKPDQLEHPMSRFPLVPLGNSMYLSPSIDFIIYQIRIFVKSTLNPPKLAYLCRSNNCPFTAR